ncbi:MAG: hypothetical protein WCP62_16465, partial [Planctomycetota bacterium]
MSINDQKSTLTLLLASIAALCAPRFSCADDPDEFFVKQALPILEKRCLSCHSHAAGKAQWIADTSRASVAIGADGLIIEIHPRPEEALSDGPQ